MIVNMVGTPDPPTIRRVWDGVVPVTNPDMLNSHRSLVLVNVTKHRKDRRGRSIGGKSPPLALFLFFKRGEFNERVTIKRTGDHIGQPENRA